MWLTHLFLSVPCSARCPQGRRQPRRPPRQPRLCTCRLTTSPGALGGPQHLGRVPTRYMAHPQAVVHSIDVKAALPLSNLQPSCRSPHNALTMKERLQAAPAQCLVKLVWLAQSAQRPPTHLTLQPLSLNFWGPGPGPPTKVPQQLYRWQTLTAKGLCERAAMAAAHTLCLCHCRPPAPTARPGSVSSATTLDAW